jgi:uncharacterized protein YeaO (DUF488 family)
MPVKIVRLGSPRAPGEGVRLGTVRHPPRGVPKDEYARRDFFDAWLPELAPSAELLAWARSEPMTDRHWASFERRYRREMRQPAARHLIATLAALSREADFSVGCYCEDEHRCHRSVLKELLLEESAAIA